MPTIPKKTIKTVVESCNHYVAQVKRNQPNLHAAIQKVKLEHLPVDSFEHRERTRGKQVTWSVHVYRAHVGKLHREWKNLNRIIQVHKVVEDSKKTIHSERFYISDLTYNDAEFYHQGIRQHWAIENRLHRVKDMVHGEDGNRIKTKNGPINMSIISSTAINIHRMNGSTSITNSQIKFCCHLKQSMEKYKFT